MSLAFFLGTTGWELSEKVNMLIAGPLLRGLERGYVEHTMVWIRGWGPGFKSHLRMFFLNKKKFAFQELDGKQS